MLGPEARAALLGREARVFTVALIGAAPSDYVVRAYARGHVSLPLAPVLGFDAALMRVARAGPRLTRAADAYARLFSRRAILRRKLTLLLAILESSSPSDAAFAPLATPAPRALARLALAGAAAVFYATAGVMIMAPLHLLSRLAASRA